MVKKFPKLESKLILAPMHDITNLAFRLMCKKYGASLVCTELLSANAIARGNKSALLSAKTCKNEKPVSAQIFGQNTEMIVKAGKLLEKDFEVIDFNLGCPSCRIMKQGSGGYLLKRPKKIKEIVKSLEESINKPLTIKLRKGVDKKESALEIVENCHDFVSAIVIHPRTVEQGYSGKADWDLIKQIKEKVNCIVIGNGDVVDGKSCKEMLKETRCDYVMIGRAAIGNPFIFKQINHFLKTGKEIFQKKEEKIKDYFEYIEIAKKYKIFSLKDAKQKAIEFTKGIEKSKELRKKLNKIKSFEVLKKELERLI